MASGFALGVVHTVLATMTLWSLMKTMLTDPGYLPRNFYVRNYENYIRISYSVF